MAGRWSALPAPEPDSTLRAHFSAELLLNRHGVLTKGAVAAEGVPGGFATLYKVLTGFEEAGRCQRGYFVESLGGAQFAVASTVDRLRTYLDGVDPERPDYSAVVLAAADPAKVLNSTVVYDPQGGCVARYDKIHLFGFRKGAEQYNESATIAPGHAATAFDADGFRVGLSICYDLRFPELYRSLGACDLLVVPAAFTETTGRAHWEILLRARAIENQCYVLAIGQGGRHENGRETHGNSMLVDPWGTILDRKLKGPGIVIGDVDPAFIADTRASLPALQHRVL